MITPQLMFAVVSILNVLFILVIVYQEHVIRKQSKVIEPLKEKIKELKELMVVGLLNETERSWNLYFDMVKLAQEEATLSEKTPTKVKKTINKKKENV